MNASGAASLAEILAGKAARQDITLGELFHPGDIAEIGHPRKPSGQHQARHRVALGHGFNAMACGLQSEFQATDSRK